MTLGSLFDGVGGWQRAAVKAGITPLWSSEIDEFCMSVTRRHFPDTVQLGDINQIEDAPHVDIITAGSPCQDLSLAGKRGGLKGEKSGLFFKAIKLVRRINPQFFVWENVPGALSSNGGNDFRTVLEEILQESVPLPRHWSNAGLVDGRNAQVAWRICDSQYWGVPQRRKRIFLVADFAGRRAAQILFERESVSGNPAPCKETQQATAARTRRNIDSAIGFGARASIPIAKCGLTPALRANEATGVAFGLRQNATCDNAINMQPALSAKPRDFVAYKVYDNHWKDSRIKRLGEVAPTVSAMYGTGGNNIPLVKSSFVRRLTPVECERLQGLPDDWTAGGSDTQRYKALGNGMAQPIADWLLEKITEVVQDYSTFRPNNQSTH